jgi:hypothetical protein
MATFDFIESDELRQSLEKDAEEVVACMKAGAWKAVHVLAGSIIQATLIDYLASSGKAAEGDLLELSPTELLNFCRDRQLLSSRTVDLFSLVRPYLHFIHPNRRIRVQEVADENGAKIAQALVEIIVNDVATRKQETYGHTAHQIVSKVQSDSSAISIIPHILNKTNQRELERLLIEILPRAYFDVAERPVPETSQTLRHLEQCFRFAFDLATDELKRKVTGRFLSVLEEESEYVVQCYERYFFRGGDLRFLREEERIVVKAHFFGSLGKSVTMPLVEAAAGIGSFLVSEQDARAFFVPLVLRMVDESDAELRGAIMKRFSEEYELTSEDNRRSIGSWIARLKASLQQVGRSSGGAIIERLESAMSGGL